MSSSSKKRKRVYVGFRHDRHREVFRTTRIPTRRQYGRRYAYVVGPFKTVRGARYMAEYGANNSHCTCVAQAEWLAKQQAKGRPRRRRL